MKREMGLYRHLIPAFLFFLEKNKTGKKAENIAEFSSVSGVPIYILYHFLGEVEGFTDELNNNIKDLMNYYGVTKLTE
jgi:hypothetical protein